MGMNHEINREDVGVWTAKAAIIRFITLEMHRSDLVKLQLDIHQEIPDSPTCLGQCHQLIVNVQWNFTDWKDFAKDVCRQSKNPHQQVINEVVMPSESKPTNNYMNCYRLLITTQFLYEPRYLVDPYQRASSSNNQHDQQHTYTQ